MAKEHHTTPEEHTQVELDNHVETTLDDQTNTEVNEVENQAEPHIEPQQPTNAEAVSVEDTETTMNDEVKMEQVTEHKPETVIVKKGGTGLALLAILIALGLGGTGYYFGQQQVNEIQQKLTALQQQQSSQSAPMTMEMPNFEQERQQIAQLMENTQNYSAKFAQIDNVIAGKTQLLDALQGQINRLNSQAKAEQPNDWLLSEADFLLNSALRKLVLDNDVDTSISLLKLADETLTKVYDPAVATVRHAINQDLKQLLAVNNVDQNDIMQRLSQLANNVDELAVLNVNFEDNTQENTKLSDSFEDWQQNIEKSATSFLNHFIRIRPKTVENKGLLAPNQDIYLRENIRLRLQIAILAVPRQQDELYKQSLETVASWVRSYFETNNEMAQNFLKSLDELAEQSIYVNTPNQLNSLNVLDKLLNRQPQEVQKIEIVADKALTEENTESAVENSAESTETQQQ